MVKNSRVKKQASRRKAASKPTKEEIEKGMRGEGLLPASYYLAIAGKLPKPKNGEVPVF